MHDKQRAGGRRRRSWSWSWATPLNCDLLYLWLNADWVYNKTSWAPFWLSSGVKGGEGGKQELTANEPRVKLVYLPNPTPPFPFWPATAMKSKAATATHCITSRAKETSIKLKIYIYTHINVLYTLIHTYMCYIHLHTYFKPDLKQALLRNISLLDQCTI